MKRRILQVLVAAAALVLAGTGTAAQAPDFNLPDLEGQRVHLKALLKGGPVLVDFWATWCKPCMKAMPKLMEIHKTYKDRGLTVLGVNADGPRSQAKVKPFVRTRGISFPVVIDGDGGVARRMQVQALPTTVLIAQDGEVVYRHVGIGDEKGLVEAIEALLSEEKRMDK